MVASEKVARRGATSALTPLATRRAAMEASQPAK